MKQRWRAWVALMDRRERGDVLALFRVGVGLVVVYSLLSIGSAGLVGTLWVDAADGGMRSLSPSHWLFDILGGPSARIVWSLYGLSLVSAIAMTLGVGGRLPILGVVIAYQAVATINVDAYGGYELMIGNAAWLLLLSDCTATWSVDCRRRHGRWHHDGLVPAWPRMIALFQLLVVYSATGLQKLSHDWVPGGSHAALYWVLQDPTWTNFELRVWAARAYRLTQLATIVTWWFEVTAVGMLLVLYWRATADRAGRLRALANRRDLRIPWAALGVSLHFGILVLVNVGPFSWISLCYYLCLWSPDDLRRLGARLGLRR